LRELYKHEQNHFALDPEMNGGKQVISDKLLGDLHGILAPAEDVPDPSWMGYLKGDKFNDNYRRGTEVIANLVTGPRVQMVESGIIKDINDPVTMQNLIGLGQKSADFRSTLPYIGDLNHYLKMVNKLTPSVLGIGLGAESYEGQ
jgi:hypothetical protein